CEFQNGAAASLLTRAASDEALKPENHVRSLAVPAAGGVESRRGRVAVVRAHAAVARLAGDRPGRARIAIAVQGAARRASCEAFRDWTGRAEGPRSVQYAWSVHDRDRHARGAANAVAACSTYPVPGRTAAALARVLGLSTGRVQPRSGAGRGASARRQGHPRLLRGDCGRFAEHDFAGIVQRPVERAESA